MADSRVELQEIEKILKGQSTQQVVIVDKAVILGDNHGSVMVHAEPGQEAEDRIRARKDPPQILPRRVSGFLDRTQEQGEIGDALARRETMDLHGRDGLGKTALISRAMETQLPKAFPDGIVYLTARRATLDDLLQDLFEHFYETKGNVKVTENTVHRHMARKKALVVVDDANQLGGGDAEALGMALRDSAVLVAGRERQVWQGKSLQLSGLPRADAVALFERHWGLVASQDRPTVEAICETLGDVPLSIVKTASTTSGKPLDQVLQQAQPHTEHPDPVGQAFWAVAKTLTKEDQQVMGAISVAGGETVAAEALPVVTGLPADQVSQSLERLQSQGLIYANSPRYSVDNAFRLYAAHYWADDDLQRQVADYYLDIAHELEGPAAHPDEGNVLGALDYYFRNKQWERVLTIARQIEGYLATRGHWGQWRQQMKSAWQAAQEAGDRASEAWAQNQLGIVAAGMGNVDAAVKFFKGALGIWRALGDGEGATIARWNLQMLLSPPPLPDPKGEMGGTNGGGGVSGVVIGLIAAAVVVTLGLVGIIGLIIGGGRVTPTPLPPRAAKVQIWLNGGCNETYGPGELLQVQLQSTVDGKVEVDLLSADGERAFLFEVEVWVDEVVGYDLYVPEREGSWALSATLNGGESRDTCRFEVKAPTEVVVEEPVVEVWLSEGCGQTYLTGEAFTIQYQASVGGTVEVYWRDPQGRRDLVFEAPVRAGEIGEQSWDVPGQPGDWLLEAELNGGQARAECPFEVQQADDVLPPTPVLEAPIREETLACDAVPAEVVFYWSEVQDASGIDGHALQVEALVFETPNRPVPELVEVELGGETSHALPLECGWAYGWRVRAIDGAGNPGEWSKVESFYLEAALPDLMIAQLETTGPARMGPESEMYPHGSIEIPIAVSVKNQGSGEASIFKTAVYYTGPGTFAANVNTYPVPFTVMGQSHSWYPYTDGLLGIGDEVTFRGSVTFSAALEVEKVALQAEADSCIGDEFIPEYCRVEEIDETNNLSKSIPAYLR